MKNITVSVPDEVYRRARIRAAEAGSSISALVTAYLRSLDADDAEYRRLVDLQAQTVAGIVDFRARDRLTRDEIHDRAIR